MQLLKLAWLDNLTSGDSPKSSQCRRINLHSAHKGYVTAKESPKHIVEHFRRGIRAACRYPPVVRVMYRSWTCAALLSREVWYKANCLKEDNLIPLMPGGIWSWTLLFKCLRYCWPNFAKMAGFRSSKRPWFNKAFLWNKLFYAITSQWIKSMCRTLVVGASPAARLGLPFENVWEYC